MVFRALIPTLLRFGAVNRPYSSLISCKRRSCTSQLDHIGLQKDDVQLNPFRTVDEDTVQYIQDLNTPMKRSYNLASYVNHSHTLQELLKLEVSLFDIENTDYEAARSLLHLDFERDCVPYIKFLIDNGLKEKNLGRFISEYPKLFKQTIDDFQVRLNYYRTKGFTVKNIAHALNKSSHFISHPTKSIDHKLGLLKLEYQMPAKLVRIIVADHPVVIAIPGEQYKIVNFTLSKEFGFTLKEIHRILQRQPTLLEFGRSTLIDRLELVHNLIGLKHEIIADHPKLITGPRVEIAGRAKYLTKLKRNQYNPHQPLYVPPQALYQVSDEEFCKKYAKTRVQDFKLFLKSQ